MYKSLVVIFLFFFGIISDVCAETPPPSSTKAQFEPLPSNVLCNVGWQKRGSQPHWSCFLEFKTDSNGKISEVMLGITEDEYHWYSWRSSRKKDREQEVSQQFMLTKLRELSKLESNQEITRIKSFGDSPTCTREIGEVSASRLLTAEWSGEATPSVKSTSFDFGILWTVNKPGTGTHAFLLTREGSSEWAERVVITIGNDGDIQNVTWEEGRGSKMIWSKHTYVEAGFVYDPPEGCCAATNQITHKLGLLRHRVQDSLRYIPEAGTIPLPGSSPDAALDLIVTYFDRLWNYVRLDKQYPWNEK